MAAALSLRQDFSAGTLRNLARQSCDANQARRLLALAAIYDGASRSEAARLGAVGVQSIHDWVLRFNARGPEGLIDGKAPGKVPKLNDHQRQQLAERVEAGPVAAAHGVVRWRLIDLIAWVSEEFGVEISELTMSRELRGLGFRKLSARPRYYAGNEVAQETYKKTSPPSWIRSDNGLARM